MNFLYLFFIGFGEIGLIVTSLGLVTHSSIPQDSRGAVAGIASFFGALGIMFCTRFGGYLFDWWSGAPFFLLGSIHALFLILGLFTIFIEANKNGGLTMESFRKMNEDFQRVHMD
jgi:MFS family permease